MKVAYLFIFFIFCFISFYAVAQKNDTDSSVVIRKFSNASINSYKNSSGFQYQRIIEPPQSLWDRFWNWIWREIDAILDAPAATQILWIALVAAALAAIILLVIKTRSAEKSRFFERNNSSINYTVAEENIHAISFEDAVNKAIAAENYKLALRLRYLQSLKNLADKDLIDWQLNKTNSDYVFEMRKHSLYKIFATLTNAFEYAWYGNNAVTKENFLTMNEAFQQFR